MVCFKSIMKSKLQVCLAFKTRSPSKLRWRLRVEVTNTCRFEAEDLILRCSGDPRALVPSLRKVIASIDPDVAMRSTAGRQCVNCLLDTCSPSRQHRSDC